MPPLDNLPPPVTGVIETPTPVPPTYDPGGQLVPVYQNGRFTGYERPPGWQPSAPTPGATPQAGTTAPGAPAENAAFDPFAAAGLVKQPDGTYSVAPASGTAAGTSPSGAQTAPPTAPGAAFDPFAAAGLTQAPDGSYRRPDVQAAAPSTPTVETPLKPGQRGGYIANTGAGSTEAISGTLGLPVDLTTKVLNAGIAGINKATGFNIGEIQNPVLGSHFWNQAFGLVGANPENVVPQTEGEAVSRGAARAITGAALPGGIARALPEAAGAAEAVREALAAGASPSAAAAAGTGGALGQSFRDYVGPNSAYGDVADMLGQIAGAGLIGGAEALGRGGATVGRGVARGVTGPTGGKPEMIIDPATGQPIPSTLPPEPGVAPLPVVATPAVQRAAVRRVARAAGQEPGGLAASIANAPAPPVAGSVPTIGQATGNLGVLGLERQLRNQEFGRAASIAREARNDVARVAALKGAQPGEVKYAAVRWFRAKLEAERLADTLDSNEAQADLDRVLAQTGVTGPAGDVQAAGGRAREMVETLRRQVKAALDKAYRAIDPDKTLALDTSPVAEAAEAIEADIGKGGELSSIEAKVFEAAKAEFRGVNKFADLRSLQSNIGAALRRVRRSPELGVESPEYRRLSKLMGAVNETIDAAVERALERERTNGPGAEGPILDALREADENATTVTGGAGGGVAGEPAAGRPAAAAGAGGAEAAGVGKAGASGGGQGDRGVSPQATTDLGVSGPVRRPQNFLEWVVSKRGVKPDADLRAMGADAYHHRAGGRLLNPNGMTLNDLREAAVEEGWHLRDPTDDNSIKEMISDSLSGNPHYRPEDQFDLETWEQQRHAEAMRAHAQEGYREQVLDVEDRAGLRLSDAEIDHAVNLMTDDSDLHPEEAVRLATIAGEQTALDVNAQRNAFGRPGIPHAEQEAMQLPAEPAQPALAENLKGQDARAVREANRRYREYKQTYREGAVGEVSATGATASGFRLNDSAVPGRLFRKGPAGADAADSLIKAAGGDVAHAEAVLGDYPAMVLRDMAMKGGEFSPAGYQRFLQAFAPTLAKFPGLAAKFKTIAEAQRQVEAAAARGEGRIRDLEDSAAAAYLGKGEAGVDPQHAIQTLLRSENVGAAFRDLMARAGQNEAAVAGIRRNLLDHILQRATSTAEAGTEGVKALAGATYQRVIADPKIRAAMEAVLTPAQRRIADAVGEDLNLAARAYNAIKVPGSPTTAADLRALMHHDGGHLSSFATLWLGDKLGSLAAGALHIKSFGLSLLAEGAGMLAGETLRARRMAALDQVERLASEMVNNPVLGRLLLERAPPAGSPLIARLRQKIIALTIGFGAPSQRANR